jgi:hypothetical protein
MMMGTTKGIEAELERIKSQANSLLTEAEKGMEH